MQQDLFGVATDTQLARAGGHGAGEGAGAPAYPRPSYERALFSGVPLWIAGEHSGILTDGLGAWTFIVLAAVGLVGTLLFLRLNLQLRAAGNTRLEPTRET